MKKITKQLPKKGFADRNRFGKKIVNIIPTLIPYVHHRLYIAQELGIIPQNMYNESDIVDEAIITIFEKKAEIQDETLSELKLELFRLVKSKLDDIFQSESWHQKSISTDKLLHQELNHLKERFTYNADEDFVMNEEMTDISYHQKDFSAPLLLYEDAQQSIVSAFDLKKWEDPHHHIFKKLYNFLSLEASNVVDLHVFGKLNSMEISHIKGVEEPVVRQIILQVKDRIGNILKNNV